jgi:transcriptional regulator with GAF, ATPase, and Fis domain
MARKLGRSPEAISPAFVEWARGYDWPGNIRELENLVERTLIIGDGRPPPEARGRAQASASQRGASLEDVERAHILRVLQEARWKIEGEAGAARILGLKPSTLRARIRKLGIQKPA